MFACFWWEKTPFFVLAVKNKFSNLLAVAPESPPTDDSFDDDDYENDEGDDEYDGDYESTEKTNGEKKTKTKTSRMEVQLPQRVDSNTNLNKIESTTHSLGTTSVTHSTTATPKIQTAKLSRLSAVRSETVPDGFRGKIDDKRQKTNLTSSKNHLNNEETKVNVKPDSYVTITKSVSGSLDNAKTTPDDDKKFESTSYTKSTTCGYFQFSCNIVYGSNGRSKICRPKTPSNGKC